MFGFRPSRFGGGDNPWFRLGSVDFGSAGIAALTAIVGMVLWAVEGSMRPISDWLGYSSARVVNGEVWRLLTWFIPNRPSIWIVLSAAIIFLLGSQLEATLGRVRMAWFIGVLVIIPSLGATLLHLVGMPGTPLVFFESSMLSSAIFYAFVAHMPTVRFFFGIPGWVLAVVFVGVETLDLIAQRNSALLLLLVIRVAGTVVAARSFGLAQDLPWVPQVPLPGANNTGRPRRGRTGSSGGRRPKGPRRRSAQPDLSIVNQPSRPDTRYEDLDLDSILDQVSAYGVDSLTPEQKAKLKAYSKDRKRR